MPPMLKKFNKWLFIKIKFILLLLIIISKSVIIIVIIVIIIPSPGGFDKLNIKGESVLTC